MIGYLAGFITGVLIGVYAQDVYDLRFNARVAWRRFNAWRKG